VGRVCFLAYSPILRPLRWMDRPLHNDPRGCAKVVAATQIRQVAHLFTRGSLLRWGRAPQVAWQGNMLSFVTVTFQTGLIFTSSDYMPKSGEGRETRDERSLCHTTQMELAKSVHACRPTASLKIPAPLGGFWATVPILQAEPDSPDTQASVARTQHARVSLPPPLRPDKRAERQKMFNTTEIAEKIQ